MFHLSTPLSSPSSVSGRQRLPHRAALECAPGISRPPNNAVLHYILFPFLLAMHRSSTLFTCCCRFRWTDEKMSGNANGLLILLWHSSSCHSNNIYSLMPLLSKSFRQTWNSLIGGLCSAGIINKNIQLTLHLICFPAIKRQYIDYQF